MISHWEDDGGIWDALLLGDWQMPGVWTVSFSLRREIDVKKAASTDGASLTDKGYRNPLLTLRGRITTRREWSELQRIMPHIHPKRKGASREPFRIIHPKTLLVGIDQVFIHEIDAVDLDNGVLTVELRAYEYTKPKPVAKPVVAVPLESLTIPLDPPRSIARYPGMHGILVDPDQPDAPVQRVQIAPFPVI